MSLYDILMVLACTVIAIVLFVVGICVFRYPVLREQLDCTMKKKQPTAAGGPAE